MHYSIKVLSIVAILISFTSLAFGQAEVATVEANATIEANLTVAGIQPVQYGILNSTDNTGDKSPIESGYFLVSGAESADVTLSFTLADLQLDNSTGTGDETLVLTGGTETGAWEDDNSGSFPSTNLFDLSSGTTSTLDGSDGEIVVWVNPLITIDGNEKPGSYTGSVTMTATYN